jgi:hypothetical protein
MKVRQRAVPFREKRIWGRAIGLGFMALALIGLGVSACGYFEGYTDGVLIPCSDIEDCREAPGTVCTNEMCVCTSADLRFCNGKCRPISECWPGAGGGGGAGGGSGGGAGGIPSECETAADCKQPGDPRCGTATCSGGVCGLELKPLSKLEAQFAGDCKEKWCDGDGNLVELVEASDIYSDGLPCTENKCEAGSPVTSLVANGDICPIVGGGVCFDGECVECGNNVSCTGGLVCDDSKCVPSHCTNIKWDQVSGETAFNCGGPCNPCFTGDSCKVTSDCISGVCAQGACQAPTCTDGVRNDTETGPDCGGSSNCPRCSANQGCKLPSDCLSGVCWDGLCQSPSCTDGLKNGDETGEDCGGPCAACL